MPAETRKAVAPLFAPFPTSSSGSGAPTNAQYLINAAHADLSSAVVISASGTALDFQRLIGANAGIGRTSSGTLSFGTDTNTTAISIGRAGTTATITSTLSALSGTTLQTLTVNSTSTFIGPATFGQLTTFNNSIEVTGTNAATFRGTIYAFASIQAAATITALAQAAVVISPYAEAAGNTSELRFEELVANGTSYIGFKAPDALAASVIWRLPTADATVAGAALTSNAAAALSWTAGAVYSAGGTDVAVVDGGTGSGTAAGARANLGVAIGVDVQAFDDDLNAIAGITAVGMLSRRTGGLWAARTISATTASIVITNGGGDGGNPSIDTAQNIQTSASPTFIGLITTGQNALQVGPYSTLAGNTGEVRFLELAAGGTNYVSFKAADALAANVTWVLPSADGTAGQVLETNGAGVLGWSTGGGSGWTRAATNVQLATATDSVSIGSAAVANRKIHVEIATLTSSVHGLVLRTVSGLDSSVDDVFRTETSAGVSRLIIDGRGHLATGDVNLNTQNSARLHVEQNVASGSSFRCIQGKAQRAGTVTIANSTVVCGAQLQAQANDDATTPASSDGALAPVSGGFANVGVFVGAVFNAAHRSTGTHTGDFTGAYAFAGGDANAVLGTITRANALVGQIGYTSIATGTGAITTGYALRALSPANVATGRTVTTAVGLGVENQGATGVTNALGIDILQQANAVTLNLGIRSRSPIQIWDGTNQVHLISETAGVIFNDTGLDMDFRVESDTNTSALVLDGAGAGALGLGAAPPAENRVYIVYPTLTPPLDISGLYMDVRPALTEFTSGTHALMAGLNVEALVLTAGAATTTVAATVRIAGAPTGGAENWSLFVAAGPARFEGRVIGNQGADVASAGNLSLGNDGNCFEITGTLQINGIDSERWKNGSLITLIFAGSLTVTHDASVTSPIEEILLANAGNFSATSGDTLTLVLSEQAGKVAWREVARTVI